MILRFFANQAVRNSSRFSAAAAVSRQQQRNKHTVAVQLDYYMSPQFAGIACALTEGLYEKAGIDTVKFLSTCPVGLEPERVRQFRDLSDDTDVVVGSIEQNVFVPLMLENPGWKLKAVAAMFNTSPLCLASVAEKSDGSLETVGAHEDTVDLLKRILIFDNYNQDPKHSVVASPRATKITDLIDGKLDAIQAYTTTEVPTLRRILESTGGNPDDVTSLPLEGCNGAKLGYSQMLFAPEEDIADKSDILQAFLQATFDGWDMAIRDAEHGARAVEEAQKMTKLNDEQNDHWDRKNYFHYNTEMTKACANLVKATQKEEGSDRYGVIDENRWDEATQWLLNENVKSGFFLDSTVWPSK